VFEVIRKIIKIDEKKCDGCGLCAEACHESAIGILDGKAKLPRDDYCDGLGNCLPVCPTGAISFEEREAAEYDVETVEKNVILPAEAHLFEWFVKIRLPFL
jgi:MinD superfamily P-loop ATPase